MFAVHNMAKQLLDGGYEELPLRGAWTVHWGGRYFVRINDSALIAFALPEQMPDEDCPFYRIISAHTDQPLSLIHIWNKENREDTKSFISGFVCGPVSYTHLDVYKRQR